MKLLNSNGDSNEFEENECTFDHMGNPMLVSKPNP
jgi:hypothetical protein